jgi:hypothetical protein
MHVGHASTLPADIQTHEHTGSRIVRQASRLAAGYSVMRADWQQDIQSCEQTDSRIFRHGSRLAAGYSGT